MTLATVIAECLALHAQAIDRLGTDYPESDPRIDPGLRDKIVRQRAKVSASLSGDPALHQLHVEALNRGLRIVLRRLIPPAPEPGQPPMPVWDDAAKRWQIPNAQTTRDSRVAELAAQFDQRGPDRIDDL